MYEDVQILCHKLKIQSLLEINGYRVHLSGKAGKGQLGLRNAVNLCLQTAWIKYIKNLEKVINEKRLNKMISIEKNIELYDVLVDKHLHTIFAKRPNSYGNKLVKDRENFVRLTIENQCVALLRILQLTKIGITETNLSLIGESPHAGKMTMSKQIKRKIIFALFISRRRDCMKEKSISHK